MSLDLGRELIKRTENQAREVKRRDEEGEFSINWLREELNIINRAETIEKYKGRGKRKERDCQGHSLWKLGCIILNGKGTCKEGLRQIEASTTRKKAQG